MIKTLSKALWLLSIGVVSLYAADRDLDGVDDAVDKCPNTPFMNTVDAQGCTVSVLLLPDDKANDTMIVKLGYSHSRDEEKHEVEISNYYTLQLNYYRNDWRVSLRTGRYDFVGSKSGMSDTTLKVKRRFRPIAGLRLYPGVALRLPTYDFKGNKTDVKFSLTTSYSLLNDATLFGGYAYTYIGDESSSRAIRNTHAAYLGAGYFFNRDLYVDLSFDLSQSKYRDTATHRTLIATLFYQVSSKWYITAEYSRELESQTHETIGFSIGYYLW